MASPEQPATATEAPATIDVSAYEQQVLSQKARADKAEENLKNIKQQLDELHTKQKQEQRQKLEDQGQWKDLWEEANKTAQDKEQQIIDLQRQLEDLRTSNETAAMKNAALSAISQSGAINAQQMLQLVQANLKKGEDGNVKVLDGGIEQDINVYLAKLKNPGSGFEHHFKPSTQAGMGAKPSTNTAGAAGMANPWAEGSINITRQMSLEITDPELAAVLKREAGR